MSLFVEREFLLAVLFDVKRGYGCEGWCGLFLELLFLLLFFFFEKDEAGESTVGKDRARALFFDILCI